MSKIIDLRGIESLISSIKKSKKLTVLVGGCFDIIHIGHIKFLKEAKKLGGILIILLESDKKVKQLKGKNRPIFTQKERACVLSSIKDVDFTILLPLLKTDEDYDQIIFKLKPDIIAATKNDPLLTKKKSQAEKVKSRIEIIPYVKTFSSSKLTKLLGLE